MAKPQNKDEFKKLLKIRPADFCILCGGSPATVGIFQPNEAEAWGGVSGKTRFFRYCLCEGCNELADKADRVEKIIRHELTAGKLNYAE